MARVSAFSIAQKDIEDFFDGQENQVFDIHQLEAIFDEHRKFWRLPESWHVHKFKDALEAKTDKFTILKLDFLNRNFIRYTWGEPSPFLIALSLHKSAYLSHYTAIYWHGLTDQVPKNIYVTIEQSKKPRRGTLTQTGIDNAFGKPQRVSHNTAALNENQHIHSLNGKYTNRLGVIEAENGIRVTSLERTLLDAAVRPLYCGGVFEVLEVYKRAAGKVSVNKLATMIRKIKHIYPYHQAIGFYLERSGVYSENQLALLKRFDFDFDFYLTYDMKEKEYSEDWRIYYPKGF